MTKLFEHGLDLERAKTFPTCAACRKKYDGSGPAEDGTFLCGAHFDEWFALASGPRPELSPGAFARALREGKYAPCWAVEEP